jgi:hypothetical protein
MDRNFIRNALVHLDVKKAMHRALDLFDPASGDLVAAAGRFTFTSDSTDGASSVEPFVVNTIMTGAGGVGGRTRFELDVNVVLGGWANALKAQTEFGADGAVTGLGSAFVAELILGASTDTGTYGVLELELGAPETAEVANHTAFIHAVLYGHATGKDKVDDKGALIHVSGVTEGDNHLFSAQGSVVEAEITHGLKVLVNGTPYYLLMATQAAFTS